MTATYARRTEPGKLIAWSYGGGVQSTALACLVAGGHLSKPNLIVMADTGREPQAVWDYLATHIQPLLAPLGLKVEVASHDLAKVDLFSTQGRPLMPMYRNGGAGQSQTFCSVEWKRRVVRRWLRQHGVKHADLWLGISKDEASRMKDSDVKWLRHFYPLADKGMSRVDCRKIIEQAGLPPAPRSSCWMCPFRGADEWALLPDDEFTKAQEVEAEIRSVDPSLTLLRSGALLTRENAMRGKREVGCDQGGFCWT